MANHDEEARTEAPQTDTTPRDQPSPASTRLPLTERLRKKLEAIRRDDPNIYPLS
jgi:hypothetical protein